MKSGLNRKCRCNGDPDTVYCGICGAPHREIRRLEKQVEEMRGLAVKPRDITICTNPSTGCTGVVVIDFDLRDPAFNRGMETAISTFMRRTALEFGKYLKERGLIKYREY